MKVSDFSLSFSLVHVHQFHSISSRFRIMFLTLPKEMSTHLFVNTNIFHTNKNTNIQIYFMFCTSSSPNDSKFI